MSKILFLLQIHKKNLFLLPTPTEVAFNTTISPRFYCPSTSAQPNHSSLMKTSRCGYITGPMIYPYLILQKVHDFRKTDGLAFCPPESRAGDICGSVLPH